MREFLFLVLWTGGVTIVPLVTLLWATARIFNNNNWPGSYHLKWWHVLVGTILSLVPLLNFIVLGILVIGFMSVWFVSVDWSWATRDVFQKPRRRTEF